MRKVYVRVRVPKFIDKLLMIIIFPIIFIEKPLAKLLKAYWSKQENSYKKVKELKALEGTLKSTIKEQINAWKEIYKTI